MQFFIKLWNTARTHCRDFLISSLQSTRLCAIVMKCCKECNFPLHHIAAGMCGTYSLIVTQHCICSILSFLLSNKSFIMLIGHRDIIYAPVSTRNQLKQLLQRKKQNGIELQFFYCTVANCMQWRTASCKSDLHVHRITFYLWQKKLI